jgi:DNA-binding transcriptional MerR regulator
VAKREKVAANPADSQADLTVEQLAYETGMSVRNIRNHQSRGLLPPPEVRARIGYYGPEHVARLRLIQEMQAEGFKLSAISRLIGEHGADADRFVGLRQAVTAPFATEAPEVYSREELVEKFGTDDDRLIEKARKLGLLVDLGGERYEAPSPALIRAAEEVMAMGIELPAALAAIEKLSRNAQTSARTFVELFVDNVWKPFDDDGRPEEGWEEIIAAIGRLRPLAFDALNATFRLSLTTEIEKAFGEVLERRQKKSRSRKDPQAGE